MSYAGMIRGAIALGLAIKAEHYFTEYGFVVTSVLALVIISTLLFGSFMPLVAKCLLTPPAQHKSNENHRPHGHTIGDSPEPSEPMIDDSTKSPDFNRSADEDNKEFVYHSDEAKNKDPLSLPGESQLLQNNGKVRDNRRSEAID